MFSKTLPLFYLKSRHQYINNNFTTIFKLNFYNKKIIKQRKCDQYWPTEGKETYKHITVSHKHTEVFAHYTVRSFIIKNNKITKMPTVSFISFKYTKCLIKKLIECIFLLNLLMTCTLIDFIIYTVFFISFFLFNG